MIFGEIFDLILRHADVVQPLLADLLAGAFHHGLLDVIAGGGVVQGIHPADIMAVGLALEVGLTVEAVADDPGGILHRDNAAGAGPAAAQGALADLLHIGRDGVANIHRGRGELALLHLAAELVGMAEIVGLSGDLLPQGPAFAGAVLQLELGGGVVGADGGVFHVAAQRGEDEVVLRQGDGPLLAVAQGGDLGGGLLAILAVKADVRDRGVVGDLDAVVFQAAQYRQGEGLVL